MALEEELYGEGVICSKAFDGEVFELTVEPQTSVCNRVWIVKELIAFSVAAYDADFSQSVFG